MDVHFDLQEHGEEILNHVKPTPVQIDTHKLFSIDEPEFDTSTYYGRFRRNRLICNLFIAFHSNSQIGKMQRMIEEQKMREEDHFKKTGKRKILTSVEDINQLRKAQTVLRTAIHPDTGEYIPWPMRMSSFIPVNLPISYGMIILPPTPVNTIVWQFVNQTYNAMINYGNRNASSTYTKQDILKSYFCACGASIGVALLIRKLFAERTRGLTCSKLIIYNSISTMFAVASAGYLNAYLMRQSELKSGIDVFDPARPNVSVGRSTAAAEMAVSQTAISRCMFAVPIMFPAFILYGMERASMLPKGKGTSTMLKMSLFYLKLSLAVPLGTAFYPQIGQIQASQIEESILSEYKKANGGQLPTHFLYNKGL